MFKECPICAALPGSPDLCDSCLTNRSSIDKLTQWLEQAVKEQEELKMKNAELRQALVDIVKVLGE